MNARLRTCYHEAGHAVIAHLLGKPWYGATVYKNNKQFGGIAGYNTSSPPTKESMTPEAIRAQLEGQSADWLTTDARITAAGYLAAGIADNDMTMEPAGGDLAILMESGRQMFPNASEATRDMWMLNVMGLTTKMLIANWALVEKIALLLDERGHLRASTIAARILMNFSKH